MDASSSSNPPIQLRPLYHDRLENMSSESSAVSEMRCSEPLLGDEMALETPGDQWQNPFSKRRRRLRLGSLSKGIGDAMPHGRRMTSRTCTLSGLSILVILYYPAFDTTAHQWITANSVPLVASSNSSPSSPASSSSSSPAASII